MKNSFGDQEYNAGSHTGSNDIGEKLNLHSNPMGVYISTYGCQMNVNDTERMYSLLEMVNYTPVSSPDQASLIIINSCSVREKPVHKVQSEVGRYRKIKERNPLVKIGVAGCVAQQEKEKLILDLPLVDFVLGTDAIDRLPQIIKELQQKQKQDKKKIVSTRFDYENPYYIETLIREPGVSTFVNIMKGCDNFCTFCVVPFTRGRERSRPLMDVLKDTEQLTARGVKEVTLLGQNVNSYRSECGADFGELLRVLAENTDIQRIRFTTSHPKDFNRELIEIIHKHKHKICEYIHLPVQSGNSEVLERMNRGYSREEYIKTSRMILDLIPGVSLSTDIIVGFPGETEAQFEDTLTLLEEVPYESLFAFKYSPRPFTKAAHYTDQVPEEIQSDRLDRLFKKHNEIASHLVKRYEDQKVRVLVENYDDSTGRCRGRSPQNKLVHFFGKKELMGQTVSVKIKEAFPQTLRGEWINE